MGRSDSPRRPQVLEMLILVLQQCHKESEDRWKRLSRQVADILLPMLAKQQVGHAGGGGALLGAAQGPRPPSRTSISPSGVCAGLGQGASIPLSELSRSCPRCTAWDPGPRDVVSP